MFPAPESNGFILLNKEEYRPVPDALGSVSDVCCVYSAAVFWLLLPSGQSSAKFLHAYSGECLDLVQSVAFN